MNQELLGEALRFEALAATASGLDRARFLAMAQHYRDKATEVPHESIDAPQAVVEPIKAEPVEYENPKRHGKSFAPVSPESLTPKLDITKPLNVIQFDIKQSETSD